VPSLELIIPESFLFIPANLSYISFCFFISFLIYRLFKYRIIFIIVLISLLSVMYVDIIFKYVIKNYYEIIKSNRTIYFYPKRDYSGKIDSLSTIGIYNYPLSKSFLTKNEENKIASFHETYINKFIDISTVKNKYNKYIYSNKRVFLNVYKYDNLLLSNRNQKARYTISKSIKKSLFPDFYNEIEYKFIDTSNNNILATAYNVEFLINTNKLRNRFLYWTEQKENEFNLKHIQNFDTVYKKLFIN